MNNETLLEKVESSLDTIRPYLLADGGNIRITELTKDNILKLEFVGACSTCKMSSLTFKAGVEEAVRKGVPEINKIEVINS
ncbi:MAG: NifU family protein [Cyclobacteriaceae bacterium]|jgi:Fe-S cluster biogenesis protein NfuA|nr:NifU family protein [Cyclobacteriaceae bacterium]